MSCIFPFFSPFSYSEFKIEKLTNFEIGTTTTPFSMMLSNKVSRYDVACAAIRGAAARNEHVAVQAHSMISRFMHFAEKAKEYAFLNGKGTHAFFYEIIQFLRFDLFLIQMRTIRMMFRSFDSGFSGECGWDTSLCSFFFYKFLPFNIQSVP